MNEIIKAIHCITFNIFRGIFQSFDMPGRSMLAAHKTGSEVPVVSPGRPER